MQAVFAWLDEAEALARQRGGLVLMMHANPFLTRRIAVGRKRASGALVRGSSRSS